jgi:hypothetical protein
MLQALRLPRSANDENAGSTTMAAAKGGARGLLTARDKENSALPGLPSAKLGGAGAAGGGKGGAGGTQAVQVAPRRALGNITNTSGRAGGGGGAENAADVGAKPLAPGPPAGPPQPAPARRVFGIDITNSLGSALARKPDSGKPPPGGKNNRVAPAPLAQPGTTPAAAPALLVKSASAPRPKAEMWAEEGVERQAGKGWRQLEAERVQVGTAPQLARQEGGREGGGDGVQTVRWSGRKALAMQAPQHQRPTCPTRLPAGGGALVVGQDPGGRQRAALPDGPGFVVCVGEQPAQGGLIQPSA